MSLISIITGSFRDTDIEAWTFHWPFLLWGGLWLAGFIACWIAGRAIARDLSKKSLSERWDDKDMPIQKIFGVKPPKLKDPFDIMKGKK